MIINKLEKIYFAELVLFFFILRWVFIVGLGDWPDDITFGFFQKTDNILFKDFFFGYLNPVNFNILNFFLLISPFNDFFDVNLVIWIIWITNIYVTLKILKNLNIYIDFKTKLLIYFLFIALYSPVNTNFIFFNYFSNLLSSLTLLFTIGYLKNQNISQIIFLSIICSLSILVKVNVGLAIFTLTLLIIFIFSQKKLFHSIIFLLLTIFFVLAVCFITSDDYFANILKIIFVSPSLEKGGFFTIFLRSLPRISFTFENQKYLKELLISVFILYPLIFITFIKLINLKNLKLKSNNNFEISDLYIYIFSSIFIFLLFFTFFEIKNSDVLFDFFLILFLINASFSHHNPYPYSYIIDYLLFSFVFAFNFSSVKVEKNFIISTIVITIINIYYIKTYYLLISLVLFTYYIIKNYKNFAKYLLIILPLILITFSINSSKSRIGGHIHSDLNEKYKDYKFNIYKLLKSNYEVRYDTLELGDIHYGYKVHENNKISVIRSSIDNICSERQSYLVPRKTEYFNNLTEKCLKIHKKLSKQNDNYIGIFTISEQGYKKFKKYLGLDHSLIEFSNRLISVPLRLIFGNFNTEIFVDKNKFNYSNFYKNNYYKNFIVSAIPGFLNIEVNRDSFIFSEFVNDYGIKVGLPDDSNMPHAEAIVPFTDLYMLFSYLGSFIYSLSCIFIILIILSFSKNSYMRNFNLSFILTIFIMNFETNSLIFFSSAIKFCIALLVLNIVFLSTKFIISKIKY